MSYVSSLFTYVGNCHMHMAYVYDSFLGWLEVGSLNSS